ncbi:hypothetical protein BKA70DRAFT_835349 [Coprinopsis sp. MPI-PUGE-AT-0042]|nr:hypothetical protein BKA70DRAFT_835349 [Coprinopsis sp. MPI-PUGE-AT-0042]
MSQIKEVSALVYDVPGLRHMAGSLLTVLETLNGDNLTHSSNQLASQCLDNFHLLMACKDVMDKSSPLAGKAKAELDKVAQEFSGIMLHMVEFAKFINSRGKIRRYIFAKADKNDWDKHRNAMMHMISKFQIVVQLATVTNAGKARDDRKTKQLTQGDVHNISTMYRHILVQRAGLELTDRLPVGSSQPEL